MPKYLNLYQDGGNGFVRGGVFEGTPPAGWFERNKGDGVFESPSGSELLIEIRDVDIRVTAEDLSG